MITSKYLSVAFALGAGFLVYVILRLPRWLFAALNRSALWEVRDRIFDDRRAGHLPDTPEVEELLKRVEWFIVLLPQVSAAQSWWLRRRMKAHGEPTFDDLIIRPREMRPTAALHFMQLQLRVAEILHRNYLTGSWSGLLAVAPRHLRDVWRLATTSRMPSSLEPAIVTSCVDEPDAVPEEAQVVLEPSRDWQIVGRIEVVADSLRFEPSDLLAAG